MNADIIRRLENLIRIGRIKTITPAKPFSTVTVSFGEITTAEIRYLNLRAGTDQTWDPPSIDEEVVVFSPSGNLSLGIAIAGLNNESFPAPSDELNKKLRLYEDGCLICYDVKTHALEAILPEGGTAVITANAGVIVNASDGMTINANSGGITLNVEDGGLDINGDVRIKGNTDISETLHVTGKTIIDSTLRSEGEASLGATTIRGEITVATNIRSVSGDVNASGISLKNHKHPGDSGGITGVPE